MTAVTGQRQERIINTLSWGTDDLSLEISWSAHVPVAISAVTSGETHLALSHRIPLAQVVTAQAGHVPVSDRLVGTEIGATLRYVSHETSSTEDGEELAMLLRSEAHGLEVEVRLGAFAGVAAVRAHVNVRNVEDHPTVIRQVASLALGIGRGEGGMTGDWQLWSGRSDWLAENRWSVSPLRELLPSIAEQLTGHDPRGAHRVVSTGTWSTGSRLPVGLLTSAELGVAWMWQVEHNGPWRWEVGQDTEGCWLALAGPTEEHSSWSTVLAPGEQFTTVPVSVSFAASFDGAVAAMTAQRRRTRSDHPEQGRLRVIFNDYMNTLNGDPTTDKLLPLVAAAGEAGAEIFCIDAGWYDDSGHWWDSVGEWRPSASRFPAGLGEVVDAIRAAGMTPGLWLEPEVIGVRSPMAERLPEAAFLSRHGQRIVEHGRYHLDLRHPEARAHLDKVIDRLVSDFGVGYFKLDYNIDPGAGTDRDAWSVGDGLLGHTRAHLSWLEGLAVRHPGLVVEACSSGAMRMDPAILSRVSLQSTSDQQDPALYPPIAASAPMMMPPEQAANWAYPQPGMSAEEASYCLVTGLLGRFLVSGFLNEMDDSLRGLVVEAVVTAKALRHTIAGSVPTWPLGLPSWDDSWVSTGLVTPGDGPAEHLVSVWRRGSDSPPALELPALAGHDVQVDTVFPQRLQPWEFSWDADRGRLQIVNVTPPGTARTLRVRPVGTD